MLKKASKSLPKSLRIGIYAGISAGVLALGSWALLEVAALRALNRAQDYLSKGFSALAGSEARSYRAFLSKSESGCRTLIASLIQARYLEDLEWSVQSCTYHKVEIPEVYLGLAFHRESAGSDPDALTILRKGMARFPQNPEFDLRAAKIYLRLKPVNMQKITEHLNRAGSIAPGDAQMNLNIMEYFSSVKDWPNARKYAERIRSVPKSAPSAKLLLSRVLANSGDPIGAKVAADEAKTLIASLSENERKTLEIQYSDVLVENTPAPASTPNTKK